MAVHAKLHTYVCLHQNAFIIDSHYSLPCGVCCKLQGACQEEEGQRYTGDLCTPALGLCNPLTSKDASRLIF